MLLTDEQRHEMNRARWVLALVVKLIVECPDLRADERVALACEHADALDVVTVWAETGRKP